MHRRTLTLVGLVGVGLLLLSVEGGAKDEPRPLPIIDVHLHAYPANMMGVLEPTYCPGSQEKHFTPIDPRKPRETQPVEECPAPFVAPRTDEDLMHQSLAALERLNIFAVTSGPLAIVRKWKAAATERIIPAVQISSPDDLTPDEFRNLAISGDVAVLGEVGTQYQGLSPSDPSLDPLLAVAEELDIPVGIHMGEGFPGNPYFAATAKYRARLSNPQLLEDALVRHPRLRVYVMHAGWPMADEMINVLYSHPHVYADVADIAASIPRREFHRYLQRLVEAGFGKRLMFGSDQMVWPQVIDVAIESIEAAEFLSAGQKRDIFYNNAARFLRLSDEEIARHHGD